MDIKSISKKYDLENYIRVLFFKNSSNFGAFDNIDNYISTICDIESYCREENMSEKVTRNILIASIFHKFNFLSNRSDDENIKISIESFIKYSLEDKPNNIIITIILANLYDFENIYGVIPKEYEKGIQIIRGSFLIGHYINGNTNSIISLLLRESYDYNTTIDILSYNLINTLQTVRFNIKSIDSKIKSEKDRIIEVLNWVGEMFGSIEKSNDMLKQTLMKQESNENQ